MSGNRTDLGNNIAQAAKTWLEQRLPADWRVLLREDKDDSSSKFIAIETPRETTNLALESKNNFTPRDLDALIGKIRRTARGIQQPVVVVAPWLSERTRDLLRAESFNYIDLTGNAFVSLSDPVLFLQTVGSNRNPSPQAPGKAGLRGPKAGRLLRTLIDVQPPYGVRELARSLDLTPGYVSRVLETLDGEALIERLPRGVVSSVEIAAIFRRWAQTYDVFKSTASQSYLAPQGAAATLDKLKGEKALGEAAITGSFAAVKLSPIAAPALLSIYTQSPDELADKLGLIPADSGTNVVLLAPFDDIVWKNTNDDEGASYVAPSQVAIDCLTGNGRMPAEGEAVVKWMLENESAWRQPSLLPASRA